MAEPISIHEKPAVEIERDRLTFNLGAGRPHVLDFEEVWKAGPEAVLAWATFFKMNELHRSNLAIAELLKQSANANPEASMAMAERMIERSFSKLFGGSRGTEVSVDRTPRSGD